MTLGFSFHKESASLQPVLQACLQVWDATSPLLSYVLEGKRLVSRQPGRQAVNYFFLQEHHLGVLEAKAGRILLSSQGS